MLAIHRILHAIHNRLSGNLDAGQKRKRSSVETKEDEQVTPANHRITAKPMNEARGHTGYLTFARKIVSETLDKEAIQPELAEAVGEEVQT